MFHDLGLFNRPPAAKAFQPIANFSIPSSATMTRSKRLRRRPSTPNLQQHQTQAFTADPASPPETPTTSPQFSRKISLKPRHQPDFTNLAEDPNIKPVGNGHQFSYRPRLGPEQLSPRSSSSGSDIAVEDETDGDDADESEDDEDDEDESDDSLPNAPMSRSRYEIFLQRKTQSESSDSDGDDADEENDDEHDDEDDREGPIPHAPRAPSPTSAVWDILLEELDPMDNDGLEALEVLYPYEVESARSRSSSWHKDRPGYLDRNMMRDFTNLNCSAEASASSSSEDEDGTPPEFDEEELKFMQHQAARRRLRRVSMSSSVGKRTHSELSDSEDEWGPCDVNDVGSSARRLRKRLHRSSLLFHDPPEQIVELDEPSSGEDERVKTRPSHWSSLAQELPYWSMEIMEIE